MRISAAQFQPNGLDRLRRSVNFGFLVLLWLQLPAVAGIGLFRGQAWVLPLLLVVGPAVVATACSALWGTSLATRLIVGVALVSEVAVKVFQLAGHPRQADAHLLFFIILAVLTLYCDWRVLLLAAGTIVVHHLVLDAAMPAAMFPDDGDFGRTAFHVLIILVGTVPLMWLVRRLDALFGQAAAATSGLEVAHAAETQAVREAALLAQLTEERRITAHALASSFEADVGKMVNQAAAAAESVRSSAGGLSSTADDAMHRTAAIAIASQQTAASVQAVANSADELSHSVQDISRHVAQAAQVAGRAVDETGRTDAMVQSLAQTATRIGTVVHLIRGIAGQTNLLSLNASIEAARAGDAGRGFSVVAAEVKELAAQTTHATDEIHSQIKAIQDETTRAVQAIAGIAHTVAELGGITGRVAAAVVQQTAAMDEIAHNAQRAALGTDAVSANLDTLSHSAERTRAAAEASLSAAGQLSDRCESMTGAVHGFVATLRSA